MSACVTCEWQNGTTQMWMAYNPYYVYEYKFFNHNRLILNYINTFKNRYNRLWLPLGCNVESLSNL